MDDWIKKIRYMYIMEYYSAKRKDEVLLFATTWIDPGTLDESTLFIPLEFEFQSLQKLNISTGFFD